MGLSRGCGAATTPLMGTRWRWVGFGVPIPGGCGDGAPQGLQSPPFGVSVPPPPLWGVGLSIPMGHRGMWEQGLPPFWGQTCQGDAGCAMPPTGIAATPTAIVPTSPGGTGGLRLRSGAAVGPSCCQWDPDSRAVRRLSSGLLWVWGFLEVPWGAELLCLPFNPRPFGGRKEEFYFPVTVKTMEVCWMFFSAAAPPRLAVGSAPTPQLRPTHCALLGPHRGTGAIEDPGLSAPHPSGLHFPNPFPSPAVGLQVPPHPIDPPHTRGCDGIPTRGQTPLRTPSISATKPCVLPSPQPSSSGSEGDPICPTASPHAWDHNRTQPWRGQTPLEPPGADVAPPPPPAVGWGCLHPATPQLHLQTYGTPGEGRPHCSPPGSVSSAPQHHPTMGRQEGTKPHWGPP